MRAQVWPRMVPTGEHSRFSPQANPANPPKTTAARKTMKLSTLLPKVGALAFQFQQKPETRTLFLLTGHAKYGRIV